MVSQSLKLIVMYLIVLFMTATVHAAPNVTATIDRNPVMERESFVLEIVANASLNSNDIDLSPLDTTDFIVGRTATSSQTQIINGSVSKTTTWNIGLVAKSAGSYTIPALTVDGVKTKPIAVKVIKAGKQTGQNKQPIFLKNTVESNNLYLQQTIKLVSRLYFSPNVELQNGSLSSPQLDGAFIKQQGKDKETSEIIMGVRYRVIERVFTITPQASGQFTIQSPTFNGEVASGNRRQFFSGFSQTKPITAFGDDIDITVNPIPENYIGTWLASELVQLNEEWQPAKTQVEVGEAITRKFTLTALNVNQEQLPSVAGTYPAEFKVYPDQSEAHEVLRQNALVAQRISSEAIVANKPGTYTLPEVQVNWFNTKTKRSQLATIPARTITVVAASGQTNEAGMTNLLPNQMETIKAESCSPETDNVPLPKKHDDSNDLIQWLTTLSGWLFWIATVIIWIVKSKSQPKIETVTPTEVRFNMQRLRAACKEGDASKTRQLLVQWAQTKFDHIVTLNDVKHQVTETFQAEIQSLNASQYSTQKSPWKGDALWQAIVDYDRTSSKHSTRPDNLPPLN